jgi:hypothetical protein
MLAVHRHPKAARGELRAGPTSAVFRTMANGMASRRHISWVGARASPRAAPARRPRRVEAPRAARSRAVARRPGRRAEGVDEFLPRLPGARDHAEVAVSRGRMV